MEIQSFVVIKKRIFRQPYVANTGPLKMEVHSLHRRARVHARPSVAAVDVAARRDAALTHTATEGRLPERLEPPVPSGGELHVQDAA